MAKKKKITKKTNSVDDSSIQDYRYKNSTRKNIPSAGLAAQGIIKDVPKIKYEYDPHLPPVLRFSSDGSPDKLPELLEIAKNRPLNDNEIDILTEAIKKHEPWLEWTTKREKKSFEVDPVALHIHERISAQAIIKILSRQDAQRDLFADPQLEYNKAVKFYEYDVEWANRLILGDSLQVMASLSKRENLAGQVQMIYMDPPYGIKFKSNFQNEIRNRSVGDNQNDLTREPEMIQAYRDTWKLGIHSYLNYMRDRLHSSKGLLKESGSIFVQISDENVHLVRNLMDEVFGKNNFISMIAFRTAMTKPTNMLNNIFDFILWYANDKSKLKYNPIYEQKEVEEGYTTQQLEASVTQSLYSFNYHGKTFNPSKGWRLSEQSLNRLSKSERIYDSGTLRFIKYRSDFQFYQLDNIWNEQLSEQTKTYVVQTSSKVIQRCILMASDPGDLILDPTCGSGSTAFVAEQFGRRWITIDTSRVAISLAKQRLLTSMYPHYPTKNGDGNNPSSGFIYKKVPHITLKCIANNIALDSIFDKYQPLLESELNNLNKTLKTITPTIRKKLKEKLLKKQQDLGIRSITESEKRKWILPLSAWQEWEVPFDHDEDWSPELINALKDYRKIWSTKMDEINSCIKANSETEELVDQPAIDNKFIRVSGPFTVEGVIPAEDSFNSTFSLEEDLETFEPDDNIKETINADTHIAKIFSLLQSSGVIFPGNRILKFDFLNRSETLFIEAEGEWSTESGEKRSVAISIGPQHGSVTAFQVENAIRIAYQRGVDDLIFVGFSFDAAGQAIIQEDANPKVRCHLSQIAPDVNMGDLLKDTASSQIFTVFGSPDCNIEKNIENEYTVTVNGVDIYDPISNSIITSRVDKIAAWFLDSDYDGKTFCITQAFFPDKSAWKKIAKALKGVIDEESFENLSGNVSLPFPAGKNKRVAVKVIDPRGNEVIKILKLT